MGKSERLMLPVLPGEVLREDFVKPLGLTAHQLAEDMPDVYSAALGRKPKTKFSLPIAD